MNNINLCISQLGYMPSSDKPVSLVIKENHENFPDRIPFYIQDAGSRLRRNRPNSPGWNARYFRWPFHIDSGEADGSETNYMSHTVKPLYKGELLKKDSRWGPVWQGDFSEYTKEGLYQLETPYQITVPFEISANIYERAIYSYLNYIFAQRSGFEIPGVRSALHLDDAVLDSNGQQCDLTGGWYDAGDFRKWLTLTQGNLRALAEISGCGITQFEQKALEEIKWGNKYFHSMINLEGQVYEDVGGGTFKEGLDIEKDWWYENHPGCNCDNAGNVVTDNIPGTGDERLVRTHYNPFVQFQFSYYQALIATLFRNEYGATCLKKAEKAWKYGVEKGHDQRTLFLATQLMAATELHKNNSEIVSIKQIEILADDLLARQNRDSQGISGYFEEKDHSDGYRSIAFSNFPAQALLNMLKNLPDCRKKAEITEAIRSYVEDYLLADAQSNPFNIVPYGVYHKTPFSEYQLFRNGGGKGKYLRTFIHPVNKQEIIHGTNSVLMANAAFLAEAAVFLQKPAWKALAEKQIYWGMGHNTEGLSLFTGIGYKHPVLFSGVHVKIPYAACAGFIGTPEDIPYQETSNYIEWSTQEVWDVPHYELAIAALNLIREP